MTPATPDRARAAAEADERELLRELEAAAESAVRIRDLVMWSGMDHYALSEQVRDVGRVLDRLRQCRAHLPAITEPRALLPEKKS